MTEQLKPCPFCGGEPLRMGGDNHGVEVRCFEGCTEWLSMYNWNNRSYENKIKADAILASVADIGTNEPFARIVINHVKDYAERVRRGEV